MVNSQQGPQRLVGYNQSHIQQAQNSFHSKNLKYELREKKARNSEQNRKKKLDEDVMLCKKPCG